MGIGAAVMRAFWGHSQCPWASMTRITPWGVPWRQALIESALMR